MTDGAGARAIGDWFGTGADRGIALVFVVTGVVGLVATLLALASRPYRRLSAAYREVPSAHPAPVTAVTGATERARTDERSVTTGTS